MQFAGVASLVFNQPLLIEARALEPVTDYVLARMLGTAVETNITSKTPAPEATANGLTETVAHDMGRYELTRDGIAIIPIMGKLVHRADWLDAMSGITGYAKLEAQLNHALANPSVRGIIWEIDSPGGTVNGAFTMADMIFNARGLKPIWALPNEYAYSAAYALASSASRVLIPETAGVGSVGVIWQALDRSQKNEAEGLRYVTIHYGARKADFNSEHKISKDAMAWAQKEINRVGEIFVEMVARNRGIDADAVRETEAGLLFGGNAIDAGFADEIISAPGAGETLATKAAAMLAAQIEEQNRKGGYGLGMAAAQDDNPKKGDRAMNNTQTPAAKAEQAQAQPESAATAPDSQALADAKAQGEKDALARAQAIMGCEEAKGREALARHFAFNTTMSEADAKAALAAAATEQTAAATDPLSRQMAGLPDADVGTGTPDSQSAGSGLMSAVMARRLGIQPGQQKGGV